VARGAAAAHRCGKIHEEPQLVARQNVTGRVDVLDARDRLVASGEAAAAAAGRWTWSGAGADGRALAAGVYFVRGRDAAGYASTRRAVLVR